MVTCGIIFVSLAYATAVRSFVCYLRTVAYLFIDSPSRFPTGEVRFFTGKMVGNSSGCIIFSYIILETTGFKDIFHLQEDGSARVIRVSKGLALSNGIASLCYTISAFGRHCSFVLLNLSVFIHIKQNNFGIIR